MWVRDSSAGVGTLTFVDPEKGVFAGLGHPISDGDTGESIALRSGEIVPCEITGCSMGTVGIPGELKGKFLSAHAIGSIRINGENGVYGTTRTGFSGQTMPVAFAQEVETGDAQILLPSPGKRHVPTMSASRRSAMPIRAAIWSSGWWTKPCFPGPAALCRV